MDAERWRKIDEMFEAALRVKPAERTAFLEDACGEDTALRREVEKMLRFNSAADNFIEEPAFRAAGELVTETNQMNDPAGPATRSDDSIDEGAFCSGDRIAGRYRVVGLVGRGGMGDVYRADDLKLKQPVALKFLPSSLSFNGAALARFYQEVSVARQISHRHVCRVYDVGETGGHHFLTMEYVRGENLSSLLKRIERPSQAKAVQIARQICAGLAAIHEQGVLHRDLKPGNVMLDHAGNVRITDFGLAVVAQEIHGREALAGTPAYMAPEQLTSNKLTVKSDIYALGLVLYEIFTGKRAFEARSLPDLVRLRQTDSTPTNPSEVVADLDPLVERVILRCLETAPERRPASALEVAAALPGGDPLAAALVAGETPSPEMVAAAPKHGAIRPRLALILLASVLAGLVLVMAMSGRAALHRVVPLPKSADVLADRARTIVRSLARHAPARDSASGFWLDAEYLFHLRDGGFSPSDRVRLSSGVPPAITFWYREAPYYLEALSSPIVYFLDPPNITSGMVTLFVDPQGNLLKFEAVPPQAEIPSGTAPVPDWAQVFREAGLDITRFESVAPEWLPPHAYDTSIAWKGSWSRAPARTQPLNAQAPEEEPTQSAPASLTGEIPIRIEAASYRGSLVYFEIVPPWRTPSRQQPPSGINAGFALLLGIFVVLLILATLVAWRNSRLGRGDRKGALRLALFIFATRVIYWSFAAHHVPTMNEIYTVFLTSLQSAVFWAIFTAIMYFALEPVLRRHWPDRIVSWSRLIAGDFRDPLVGRDVLIGAVIGSATVALTYFASFVPGWFGLPPALPHISSGLRSLGLSGFVPHLMNQLGGSVVQPFFIMFLLLFLGLLLRRPRLGLALGWLLLASVLTLVQTQLGLAFIPSSILIMTLWVFAAWRFGLLTVASALLFHHLVVFFPITSDLSAWYATSFLFDLLLLIALAVWAAYTAVAGEPLLRPRFLED